MTCEVPTGILLEAFMRCIKAAVSSLLMHWIYCGVAISHLYIQKGERERERDRSGGWVFIFLLGDSNGGWVIADSWLPKAGGRISGSYMYLASMTKQIQTWYTSVYISVNKILKGCKDPYCNWYQLSPVDLSEEPTTTLPQRSMGS